MKVYFDSDERYPDYQIAEPKRAERCLDLTDDEISALAVAFATYEYWQERISQGTKEGMYK